MCECTLGFSGDRCGKGKDILSTKFPSPPSEGSVKTTTLLSEGNKSQPITFKPMYVMVS